MELDVANCASYLRAMGIAPRDAPIDVCALSGGVSNTVLRARWPDGAIVVKQSLPELRVAANWLFDRSRIFVERDCLNALDELLPGTAPRVVFSDEPNYVLGMTLAPPDGTNWRDQLASGTIDDSTVGHAARTLGLLQKVSAANSETLAAAFDSRMPLIQGRIDPFHRHVATCHPQLAARINAEVDRMLSTRTVLAHGDYSPKNIVAYQSRVLLLDCEVAHWGDPAFDPAFLLCHLLLDGAHHPEIAGALAGAAAAAWATYCYSGGRAHDEAAVVSELGCLTIARVDGKSPLTSLTSARADAVRAYGVHLLTRSAGTVEQALEDSAEFLGAKP